MTTAADWVSAFEDATPRPGCSDAEIQELLMDVARPLNDEEASYLAERLARNPYLPGTPEFAAYVPSDPRSWPWPSRGLPASYLSFLRWSNGGTFGNRRRRVEFMAFDPGADVSLRNIMLSYLYPMAAPNVVPFGYDEANGGAYYGFDTTNEPVNGEFPVVYIPYGGAMWVRLVLANSFPEFCQGGTQSDRMSYWDWYRRRNNSASTGTSAGA